MVLEPKPSIRELSAYSVPKHTARIKLNSNESPWPLPPELLDEIFERARGIDFSRYPDSDASQLRSLVAAWLDVGSEQVMVGSGSNELLLYCFLAYGGEGRRALSVMPTYAMFPKLCLMTGTEDFYSRTNEPFEVDISSLVDDVTSICPSIVYLPNPNNPTGRAIDVAGIEEVAENFEGLLVVDEAYGEFCGFSCLGLLKKFENIVIVKTFSKALRLAGLRVGVLVASPSVRAELYKVKLPYNLNAFSQVAASTLLENYAKLKPFVDEIVRERERLFSALCEIDGVWPIPSQANFILFKTDFPADGVFDGLLERGILVRNFDGYQGLKGYLRVTVGTRDQNDAFIGALRETISLLNATKSVSGA